MSDLGTACGWVLVKAAIITFLMVVVAYFTGFADYYVNNFLR